MNGLERAVGTKVRAKYGKMLNKNDYKLLLSKQSVPEIALYLKTETSYSNVLNNIQEMLIHRGQLENLIRKETYNNYSSLRRYINSSAAPVNNFYSYLTLKIEIEQILNCILYINANIVDKIIVDFPSFLLRRASFNVAQLAKVKNFNDLLEVLKKTRYYDVLKQFDGENKTVDYTMCEIKLYTFYYKSVFDMIKNEYHGRERDDLTEIFKLNAELYNLTTVFRLKHFYKIPPEQIGNYLLPHNYKITKRQLDELICADNEEILFKQIKSLSYSKYSELTVEKHTFIERYAHKVLFSKMKTYLKLSTYPSVAFVAYMTLCDIEIRNIINIIEGIRYKAIPSDIEKLLIT